VIRRGRLAAEAAYRPRRSLYRWCPRSALAPAFVALRVIPGGTGDYEDRNGRRAS